MTRITLTEARVKALKPRQSAYDTRDGKLKGFGVRMLPSGKKRFFVHCQHRGERVWKIVGDAGSHERCRREESSHAAEMLAAIRRGEDAPSRPEDTLFEAVAETVFERYARVWKARTLYVNRGYLRRQLLPRFAGRQIADIDRQDVRTWFAALRATPVAADRSMPVLSVIMREAEAMGLRPEGSNPCRGLRRYRRKGRERFLSDDEIRRLSATLSAHVDRCPQQVAAIRLLLLTGCRKGELLTLRWSDYREGHLFLRDSKTGTPNRLALAAGPEGSRHAGADEPMGLSGLANEPSARRELAGSLLVPGPRGGRPVRRAASRFAAHSCQPCAETGRNRPGDRQAARSPESRDDAQIHPSGRHNGS